MSISIASALIQQTLQDHSKSWANGRGGLTVNEIAKLMGTPSSVVLGVVTDQIRRGKLEMFVVDGPPTVMRWLIYRKNA